MGGGGGSSKTNLFAFLCVFDSLFKITDFLTRIPLRVRFSPATLRTIHRAIAMLHTDVMQLITTCKVAPSKETEGGSGAHLLSNIYNLQKSILPRQMQPQSPTTKDAE